MSKFMIIATVIILAAVPIIVRSQGQENQDKGAVHTLRLPVVEVHLKPGPGFDKVSTLCNICHSTDYITMQPAFPRTTWTAEVNKMIKVMGAPVNEEDAKTIVNYLVTNYGTGN